MSTPGDSGEGAGIERTPVAAQPDYEPMEETDGTVDFLYLVDRLEELVGVGKRVPFSNRVMVQDEAAKILDVARQQAEYIVSQHGILAEARQRGEELLQQVEVSHRRSISDIDQYAIEQFTRMEEAMQDGMNIILDAVREASATLEQAKRHVGQ
jgi:hypothetical protein